MWLEIKSLPLFGQSIATELRKTLNLKGKYKDATALRVIAKVEKDAALDLLLQAMREGSSIMKGAACFNLPDGVPSSVNDLLIDIMITPMKSVINNDARIFARNRLSSLLREADIERLKQALDGMLDGLPKLKFNDSFPLWNTAAVIAGSNHPNAVSHLQKRLDSARDEPVSEGRTQRLETLFSALEHRKLPSVVPELVEYLKRSGYLAFAEVQNGTCGNCTKRSVCTIAYPRYLV